MFRNCSIAEGTHIFPLDHEGQVLPPTDRCAINRERSVRQENVVLPGSKNPEYSVFPASLRHDRMMGPWKSPGNAGGLVGRHTLSFILDHEQLIEASHSLLPLKTYSPLCLSHRNGGNASSYWSVPYADMWCLRLYRALCPINRNRKYNPASYCPQPVIAQDSQN